ncbi:MAG: helix-turn-helix domain-containing protein [Candidatus Micrarchaeota archaeon]
MDRGKVKGALALVGLTPIDSDIYLYVSANPNCRAGRIISELDLNRSKVYDSLNKLTKMGLLSCVLTNYVKRYASTGPEMLRRTYESKSEAMGETINYLSSLGIQEARGLKIRMVEGEEGYKSVKDEFLSQLKKGDELLIMGAPLVVFERLEYYLLQFHKRRRAMGVDMRAIYNTDVKKFGRIREKWSRTQVRYLHKGASAWVEIFRDSIMIPIFSERVVTIAVSDPAIASSFRDYFEVLWKSSR